MNNPNNSTDKRNEDAVIELDPSEIIFEHKIGEGSYGFVFAGRCRAQAVAIKVFKRKEDLDDTELAKFREEIKIMSKIFHPNIVLFMGACTQKGKELMLVTEKMPTDMETLLIKEKKNIPLFNRMKMAKDAAMGMNWLHCSNPVFIHRDLKLSNLLVDNQQKVCVCDFGLAQMKPRNVSNLDYDPHGSPIYMAPEVFIGEFNEKCDVYSFGICLWEMVTQEQAFSDIVDDLPTFIEAVCEQGQRPRIPDDCLSRLAKLITSCWAKKSTLRPSFEQILVELDKTLIEIAIEDSVARKMWKRKFCGRFEVPWEEFLPVLLRVLHINEYLDIKLHIRCLQSLLIEDSKAIVGPSSVITILRLGKILSFFGPLKVESGKQDLSLFHKIKSTLEQKWFHGDITTEEAESRLKMQSKGAFLVRLSSTMPGCFTISYRAKDKQILHHRAKYVPGEGYYFYEKRYDSLESLIKVEGKKNFHWKEPCLGSKYQHLFTLVVPQPIKPVAPHGYVAEKDDSKRKK